MNIPARFVNNFTKNLKRYQAIVRKYKKEEVNEAETVKVINDILSDLFGYDKYNEITSEYCVKHTYCDLAIKDSGKSDKIYMFIEVKAASCQLTERHVEQTVDYARRDNNVKWVILTNGEFWRVYKVKGSKQDMLFDLDFLQLNPKDKKQMEYVYSISKFGKEKSAIDEIYTTSKAKNKYVIAALLNRPEMYKYIRNIFRRYLLEKGITITEEEIADYMQNGVLKREVIDADDNDEVMEAIRFVNKKLKK